MRSRDIDALATIIAESASWPAASGTTVDALPERLAGFAKLRNQSVALIEGTRLAFADDRYARLREGLDLLHESTALVNDRLQAALPIATGLSPTTSPQRSQPDDGTDTDATSTDGKGHDEEVMTVTVSERPFGMHLTRGSAKVKEVFPGFPAQRLGIRPGCEVEAIAGTAVASGTWLEAFQNAQLPFELKLACAKQAEQTVGPISNDTKRYRVMVAKRPYGMNVQVNVLPRVTEVLPGYPAEAAGVRRGFVLTEVAGQPVNGKTWFKLFQSTKMPFTLTFDTTVPLHEGNPFFDRNATGTGAADAPSVAKKVRSEGEVLNATTALPGGAKSPIFDESLYEDVKVDVPKTPFGMQVRAPLNDWPVVHSVVKDMPAASVGILAGDVLVEVAGRPVNSATWFAAFQQAAPPFGLKFRRKITSTPDVQQPQNSSG